MVVRRGSSTRIKRQPRGEVRVLGGSEGSPVLVQQPTGTSSQNWYLQGDSGGNAFEYDIATFGFWQPSALLSTAIADVNGFFVFASASDEPPAGG